MLNYDKDVLIKKLKQINYNIEKKGILDAGKGNPQGRIKGDMLTGYSYGEFYDWDLYFENIYLAYFGIKKFCRNNVEEFLDKQLACGFVARTIMEPRWRQHFKPFLAQIVLLGYKQGENILWIKDKYYTRLKKYLDYWMWFEDYDNNGLSVWDSADHTGMDNQDLRAGEMYSQYCEGVDLNCYIYRELKAMEVLAKLLGETNDVNFFNQKADELKNKINQVMWDDEDGFYYDRNERTGNLIKVKSASSFAPIWAGIASEQQVKILVEKHILNEEEFWLEHPISSWAKNEEGYYQQRKKGECTWMGACWIPINYMLMHGLVEYGYTDLAKELAQKTFDMVYSEEEVREYYNAETGIGQGLNPFWGWSTLAYFMPFEIENKENPTRINTEKIKILGKELFNLDF